jgi:histidine triad (HIT) family protein
MTIFSAILAGDIPCHRVFENDHVLAFLDIGPLSRGHLLVIPKEAKATLGELSDDAAAELGRVLPRLCRAVCAASGATSYNVLQNNGADAHQAVMHVHFHVIPRYPDLEEGDGLHLSWRSGSLEDGADLAASIAAALDG